MNYQNTDSSEELEETVGQELPLCRDADCHGERDGDEDEGGGDDGVVEHVAVDGQVYPTDHKTVGKYIYIQLKVLR